VSGSCTPPHVGGGGQHWHRWRDRDEAPIPEEGGRAGPSPRWHSRLSLAPLRAGEGQGCGAVGTLGRGPLGGPEGLPRHLLGGSGRGGRTGSQEANAEQDQQQPSPPGEIRGPEVTPGAAITLGHQPTGPLPWGLRAKVKEQFFWFQNEAD